MGRFGNLRERTIDDEYETGWVPPGYDNLGPGNEVRIGPAGRSSGDVRARTHDIGYGDEEAAGVNPYVNWVDADEEFLNELNVEGPSTLVAKGLFSAKKVGKSIGVIGDMSGYKKRQTNLKAMPNTIKRKPKPKEKAKRKNPWEEGEEFRAARENQARRWREAFGNRPGEREHNAEAVAQLARDQETDWEQETKQDVEPEPWAEFTVQDAADGWNANNMQDIDLSLANLPNDEEDNWDNEEALMAEAAGGDVDMSEETAMAARSGGGGGNGPVSKETPISRYPTLTYGLQETHTTILPFTCWFTMTGMSTGTNSKIQFRMNSPYDMIVGAVAAGAPASVPVAGTVYSWPMGTNGNLALNGYPETINNNLTTEAPYWRRYWEQYYEHYTVLGCEWKATVVNPVTTEGASVILAYNYDAYNDVATAVGNVTPDSNLSEMMSLKGVNFEIVPEKTGANNGKHTTTLRGRYKPGDAKRNIINDGDVKTWTRTNFNDTAPMSNGPVPALKEFLNIWCWRAPLSSIVSTGANSAGVNIQMELKWIVQFKDLRGQARYPVTGGGGASIATTISTTRLNIGNPIGVWT